MWITRRRSPTRYQIVEVPRQRSPLGSQRTPPRKSASARPQRTLVVTTQHNRARSLLPSRPTYVPVGNCPLAQTPSAADGVPGGSSTTFGGAHSLLRCAILPVRRCSALDGEPGEVGRAWIRDAPLEHPVGGVRFSVTALLAPTDRHRADGGWTERSSKGGPRRPCGLAPQGHRNRGRPRSPRWTVATATDVEGGREASRSRFNFQATPAGDLTLPRQASGQRRNLGTGTRLGRRRRAR